MNNFQITQDYAVYPPKKQGIYPIQESDWERIKRLIGSIIPPQRLFQILSSLCFGIFASAIFSLISFLTAERVAPWVMPTAWTIFWVSLLVGCALLLLDGKQKKLMTVSTNDVLQEMAQIEQHFERPDGEA